MSVASGRAVASSRAPAFGLARHAPKDVRLTTGPPPAPGPAGALRRAAPPAPAAADAGAHALRGGIAWGNVRARRMGMDLHLDLQDGASRVAYFMECVKRPLLALWKSELRPGDVMADIGAHIGITAVAAGKVLRELGEGGKV